MNAEIISVGTELLLGQILNTNAKFLSQELSKMGINVFFETVVGDNALRLKSTLKSAMERSDILILTGGLGPTEDDLTKETIAELFSLPLVLHEESLSFIQDYFNKIGRTMADNNKKQAMMPEGAFVIKNNYGTAPGVIIEKDGKYTVLMPGPPREMEPMFLNDVKPYFEKMSSDKLFSKVLRIFGIGESSLEEKIIDLIRNGQNPTIAPYAKEGEVTLRITARANDEKEADSLINPVIDQIRERIGDLIYAEGDDKTLFSVVAELLIQKNITIATAESCTGGTIASSLIDIEGISSVFLEGIVTYSNEAKVRLGVNEETLKMHGAVSEEAAIEMAKCIRQRANADIGISTTGIAGPGGGTDKKPVGLVYIAVASRDKVVTKKLNIGGDRWRVRRSASMNAVDLLRKFIEGTC